LRWQYNERSTKSIDIVASKALKLNIPKHTEIYRIGRVGTVLPQPLRLDVSDY